MKDRNVAEEDTQSIKEEGFCGYRLKDEIYYLMDFKHDEILESMNEVAFLFDHHKSVEMTPEGNPIMPTLLKHGSPNRVNECAKTMRKLYTKNPTLFNIAADLIVIQGKFPIKEIDKMLSITGYIYKEALKNEG